MLSVIFSFLFIGNVLANNTVSIGLQSNWNHPGYELQLLETAVSFNETLYVPLIQKIFQITDDEDEDSEKIKTYTDEELYNVVADTLPETILDNKAFFDIYLANNYYSPRIISHFNYYQHELLPKYESQLSKCSSSMGDKTKSWIYFHDEIICNPGDIFALKTNTNKKEEELLLPFDRVISTEDSAPLLIFYGDYKDPEFKNYFINLLESSKSGKIRFVWRYIPNTDSKELLGGYGADMTLKRTDYIVIDDRDIKSSKVKNLDGKSNEEILENTNENNLTIKQIFDKTYKSITGLSRSQVQNLDLKLTNYILNKFKGNDFDKLKVLIKIINNFPKYASDIANSKFFKINKKNPTYKTMINAIEKNIHLGVDEEMKGIFINGKMMNPSQYNLFDLLSVIKEESKYIIDLAALNLSPVSSKGFISEFARLSVVSKTKKNGIGEYKRYNFPKANDIIEGEGIVYINDLESNEKLSTDRRVWLNVEGVKQAKFPNYKENVLELVFVLNLSNRKLLRVAYSFINQILSRGIVHRIGILPISLKSEDQYYEIVNGETIIVNGEEKLLNVDEMIILDQLLAKDFYKFSESVDNPFLYLKYLEKIFNDDEYYGDLWANYLENSDYLNEYDNSKYLENFSIVESSFIVDGVLLPYEQNWQMLLTAQFYNDVELVAQYIASGKIPLYDDDKQIKDYLYESAPTSRNLIIDGDLVFKYANVEYLTDLQIGETLSFTDEVSESKAFKFLSLSLIGDFNTIQMKDQLREIILYDLEQLNDLNKDFFIKFRLIDTSGNSELIKNLKFSFGLDKSIKDKLTSALMIIARDSASFKTIANHTSTDTLESLKKIDLIPANDPIILVNSRMVEISKVLNKSTIEQFVNLELSNRLFSALFEVIENFQQEHGFLSNLRIDRYDWSELFFVGLTKTFYSGQDIIYPNSPRYQLNVLELDNVSLSFQNQTDAILDLVVIIDPLEEFSQKVLNLVESLVPLINDTSLINLSVLFAPRKKLEEIPIKRFYKGNYLSNIKFDEDGNQDLSIYSMKFDNVPNETLFTLDLDIPHPWIVHAKKSEYDLDNIKLDLTENHEIHGLYELSNIIIEGYSEIQGADSPSGIQLQLNRNEEVLGDTNVMANYGYFQLSANPGIWEIEIKDKSAKEFSFENHQKKISVSIMDMNGIIIKPKLIKRAEESEGLTNKLSSWFSKISLTKTKKKQADINIFAVASGHLYERLLSIMTASVRNHTNHSVKFWIIDNYMSANFQDFLPHLAEKYVFEYELITYKWPEWLRSQREKQRTIWGYKILFLDVLFPQDLEKVIFVDADQIIRTDLMELMELDLEGAPYGYTPMCDSRKEMEGFRFWKQGYWKSLLDHGKLKYHISALYVIDLTKFRELLAGDILRHHYQQLSADPGSLSNLDQDLPNNLQYNIKIHSLPQEWLWCETWCSDESLAKAKTIDLCNNPLTKEPKLERAKRLIPEWSVYDEEIGKLMDEVKSKETVEEVVEEDIVEDDFVEEEQQEGEEREGIHDEL